jgi:hypothetical protein
LKTHRLVDRRSDFAPSELAQGGALQILSRFPVAVLAAESSGESAARTSTLSAGSGGDQYCTAQFDSSHPASENPRTDLVLSAPSEGCFHKTGNVNPEQM